MSITPYLFYEGRAEEAIGFYAKALGATTAMLMRNSDSPDPPPPGMMPPGSEHKIMHAEIRIGELPLMLSDGHCAGAAKFAGFGVSLPARDAAEAGRFFAGLSDGGEVRLPLGPTFFSPAFGMVQDRFGVLWMVNVMQDAP
ncbi:VOC family protein [Neoroseomonas oryzicola]|uniref:VOC family protein n=1 Tax=Neoroseomonas oryzicola TaxID=535904 RepID=A0A9X9WDD6_9PROT|nr:VOC family protein [Neoroseomonas oryzicola]MBR0658346.1 VOC family protein [Neoroseomonas oryzicola]NKE18511.1 VOC family protein [Neoroseomonas oryzicola]